MAIKTVNITNKKAGYEFHILQKFAAGISLNGTEVKSVREGNANINDAYCLFIDEELFIKGMNIGKWKQGGHYNHDPLRLRKLLLRRIELRKLTSKAAERGFSIVPLRVFISETGYVKVEIAIARGKKDFDKRESIKERDVERSLRRNEE